MNAQVANGSARIVNPGNPVPRGIDDFGEARTQGCCLVDKSRFIGDVLTCDDKIALITRPRRFGKTINQSMLRYFLE
ncbi:MAG: AAA family ATPase, partial [Myxococcota bacterium]